MILLIDPRTKRKKENKGGVNEIADYAFVEDCAVRIIIAIEITTCLLQCEHQNESQNEISISCEIKRDFLT